ncbi:ABC transporter permease subunit [bacterium]|nr:ABC transporter permease subunit [candidate division CSSED10-310 bacterium]
MIHYIIRRIMMMIPVLLGVSLLVFFMIHLIPGDPVQLMLGDTAQPADIEKLRHEMGLDKPLHLQLAAFLKGLMTGDLGRSLHSREPVTKILTDRFPATLELTLVSMLVAVAIALPLGIISAVKANTAIDHSSMFLALLGVSIPNFWLGPMLILIFSVQLNWLVVSGRSGPGSYILPAITLGTALAAILTRMTRASLLEVMKAPYITTAYAKGASHSRAIFHHALRNALIPVTTIMGLQIGALLGGSVITETVFSWPGIGRELIQAIQGRDYPVVQGCVLLIAFCYVLINLVTDLIYGILDPRITYESPAPVWRTFFSSIGRQVRQFIGWYPKNLICSVSVILVIWWARSGFPLPLHCVRFQVSNGLGGAPGLFGRCVILMVFPGLLFWWRSKDPMSWRSFLRSPRSLIGMVLTGLFLFLGLFGPDLTSVDPTAQDLAMRLTPPNLGHWFGMDHVGRDLLSRVLHGARVSMIVGTVVTLVSMCIGLLIGLVSGLAGGWLDDFIMRIVDVLLAFPGILLAIGMVAVLGPDIRNVMIALCIMGWVGYARLARGQTLALRQSDYVQAARSLGAGPIRIMSRHLLPNILAPIIVQATLGMAGVIIAEAGLSFLGLGVQPPSPSWGGILNSGVYYFREAPHMTVFPGLAIMIVVLGLNFLGDGLRDALDPKTRD